MHRNKKPSNFVTGKRQPPQDEAGVRRRRGEGAQKRPEGPGAYPTKSYKYTIFILCTCVIKTLKIVVDGTAVFLPYNQFCGKRFVVVKFWILHV
jgi:hypothetical protein